MSKQLVIVKNSVRVLQRFVEIFVAAEIHAMMVNYGKSDRLDEMSPWVMV